MHRFTQIFTAVALALLSMAAAPAQAAWHKAESRNFTIYGDMKPDALRREVLRLEGFDRLLRLRFGIKGEEAQVPLSIYLLGRNQAVEDLAGRANVGGFYRANRFGSFAVVSTEREGFQNGKPVEDVLLHEYTHHFFFRHLGTPRPGWYVEGFAQYLATAALSEKGEWTVGYPANNRAFTLRYLDMLPLRTLLSSGQAALSGRDRASFYARSWLFTHMLYSNPQQQARLDAYLAAVARGTDSLAAAEAAFGDLRALDRALDKYEGSRLVAITYDPIGDYTGPMRITALDPEQTQLVMHSLRRRNGHMLPETRDALQAMVSSNPAAAEAWFELALVQLDLAGREKNESARAVLLSNAEAAADQVLALQPRHGRGHVLKADLAMRRLVAAKDFDAAKWRMIRANIVTANEADPNDPAPLFTWFNSFRRQGKPPTQSAHDGLARAFALQPEVTELRADYAFDLARMGRYDEAIALIRPLAGDPHRSRQAIEIMEKLEAMRGGKTVTLPDEQPSA